MLVKVGGAFFDVNKYTASVIEKTIATLEMDVTHIWGPDHPKQTIRKIAKNVIAAYLEQVDGETNG